MAARFNASVYITGSAVAENDYRDVDIFIVLNDDEFEGRYGLLKDWQADVPQLWIRDVAEVGRKAVVMYGLNMDLKIVPRSYWNVLPGQRFKTLAEA